MNNRDIEAAADKLNNRLEREWNDPQPERPEPEYERADYTDADIIRLQRDSLAAAHAVIDKQAQIIEMLEAQAKALHLAVKQRDETIRKMTDEQDRAE